MIRAVVLDDIVSYIALKKNTHTAVVPFKYSAFLSKVDEKKFQYLLIMNRPKSNAPGSLSTPLFDKRLAHFHKMW